MLMCADKKVLKGGETATMQLRGLEKGMFAGWQSSDTLVSIKVGAFMRKGIDSPFHVAKVR